MTIVIEEYSGCLEQVHVFEADEGSLEYIGKATKHEGVFTMEDFEALDKKAIEADYRGQTYRMYEPTLHLPEGKEWKVS